MLLQIKIHFHQSAIILFLKKTTFYMFPMYQEQQNIYLHLNFHKLIVLFIPIEYIIAQTKGFFLCYIKD